MSKVYVYERVSTQDQTFMQQRNAIDDWLKSHGMKADEFYGDEGISGSVSYKKRKLALLVEKMESGDVLIVSELSRIGRNIFDVNKFIQEELKPRKIRLVVVKMNLDLRCDTLKAVDEMVLFAFSFASQVEKELIQSRTQEAMSAIKKDLSENGFHVSKKGRKITKLGTPGKVSKIAINAAAEKKAEEARRNPANVFFKKYVDAYTSRTHGVINYKKLAHELNQLGQTTASGMPYTEQRARAMYSKIKKLYTE